MPKQTDAVVMANNAIASLCAQPRLLFVTLAVSVVCAACTPGANACHIIDGNIGLQSQVNGSGLPPLEAPVMIAEKRKLFFSFCPGECQSS